MANTRIISSYEDDQAWRSWKMYLYTRFKRRPDIIIGLEGFLGEKLIG